MKCYRCGRKMDYPEARMTDSNGVMRTYCHPDDGPDCYSDVNVEQFGTVAFADLYGIKETP